MGGTYSDTVGKLLVFGPQPELVAEFANEVKEVATGSGAEVSGPSPLPQVFLERNQKIFQNSNDGATLFGQVPSNMERNLLPETRISRKLVTIYNGDRAIRKVLELDVPDLVFLRFETDKRTHGTGGVPSAFSYDPAQDYGTEI